MRNELLSGTLRAVHLALSKLNTYLTLALTSAPAHEETVTARLLQALNTVKNATRSTLAYTRYVFVALQTTLTQCFAFFLYSLLNAVVVSARTREQRRQLCSRSCGAQVIQ